MSIQVRPVERDRHFEVARPMRVTFGTAPDLERNARTQRLEELEERFGAFDGDEVVGCSGAFAFSMTTPGGRAVPISGLTMVGVLPTHRRRGILTSLVRAHFERARARGIAISALWASEPVIYGRFGYGPATWAGSFSLDRARSAFRRPPPPGWHAQIVDEAAALARMPPLWDRARAATPGMMSRSLSWWESRRIGDFEKAGPPLQRVVVGRSGADEGYALLRFTNRFSPSGIPEGNLQVVEAIGATPLGTELAWRYVTSVDLVNRIEAMLMPRDHAVVHLLREGRRLGMTSGDAMWLRVLDVGAALSARRYGDRGALTLAIDDALCPWNAGRWRIDGEAGSAAPTESAPELRLDVAALGSVYLGGTSVRSLADAGEVEEMASGAIERADALFRAERTPWCPEVF